MGGGGGGGGGGDDDRRQERERQEREARRERERFERERRRLDNERRERERREREQRESDDSDKRRAEEQARAQREAEERQARERARREAEAQAEQERQAAAEAERLKQADADKQRAAEIEARQVQAEGRAKDERQRLKAEPTSKSLEGYEQRKKEALERAEFISGDESFVRGGAERSIVTGGRDGKPVLTRQGVERQAAFEQEELERLVSLREGGEGDPEQGKRNLAKQIIEEKLEKGVLPGTLGAIQKINLENQLKNLEKGGTPTFRVGPGGEFTTSGVLQPGEEGTGIAPNITSDLETMMDEPERDEQPTILQAQPDEADVTVGTLGIAPAPRGRRGTRSKRAGAAGTLLEGGGVLYD